VSPLDPDGIGRVLVFWLSPYLITSARRPRGRRFGRWLTGESFQKSTDSGLRGVAPGGRFWHGPADL